MAKINKLRLNQINNLMNAFSPVQCAYYAEAGVIALENQKHQPGVQLKIEGNVQESYQLEWESFIYSKSGWQEPREIAENGAIAIGILVILELTAYQIVEQSIIGSGFDFWLGYKKHHKDYDPDNFLNARLEVSGINKGNRADVVRRARKKLQQLKILDYLNIPGYVIVTEFSAPMSLIVKK